MLLRLAYKIKGKATKSNAGFLNLFEETDSFQERRSLCVL